MYQPSNARFRTDLTEYLMDLLDFIEEKIEEAQKDQASREGALSEAMGAFPIMNDRLYHEDPTIWTQLLLTGFFEKDLTQLAAVPHAEFAKQIDELRPRFAAVRTVLASRIMDPES
jgi:hypothetical protein